MMCLNEPSSYSSDRRLHRKSVVTVFVRIPHSQFPYCFAPQSANLDDGYVSSKQHRQPDHIEMLAANRILKRGSHEQYRSRDWMFASGNRTGNNSSKHHPFYAEVRVHEQVPVQRIADSDVPKKVERRGDAE